MADFPTSKKTWADLVDNSSPANSSDINSAYAEITAIEDAFLTDSTSLNASTDIHGFLPKLSGTVTEYLDGSGAWSTPPGGGGASSDLIEHGHTGSTDGGLLRLDTISAPTDSTSLNASTDAHGLLPKLSGTSDNFLNGKGEYVAVASGGTGANLLINGGFDFFQRVGAAAAAKAMTDDAYNAPDRWYSLIQGANATIQQEAGIGTSKFSCKLVAGGTTNRYGIAQITESSNSIPFRGRTVIAQVKLKPVNNAGSGTRDYRIAILEWTGTADAVTSEIVADWTSGTFTTAGFFASTTLTLVATAAVTATHNTETALTVSGTVSASCNNLIVFIWTEDVPAHASDYVLLGEAGLYDGSTAQAWQPRPIAQELNLCLRYYETGDSQTDPKRDNAYDLEMTLISTTTANGVQYGQWPYLVAKFADPTVYVHPYTTGTSNAVVSRNDGLDLAANSGDSVGGKNRLAIQNNSGGTVTTNGLILFKYEAECEL